MATTVLEIAQQIVKDAAVLDSYWTSYNLPQPCFDPQGPQDYGIPAVGETAEAQLRLIEQTHKLHTLIQQPWSNLCGREPYLDAMALQAVMRLQLPQIVPVDGEMSFQDIASQCRIKKSDLVRILRYAALNYVFQESRPGFIRHTALSRCLRDNSDVEATVRFLYQETFPGSAYLIDAMREDPDSDTPTKSGWALANDAEDAFFEELTSKHPERAKQTARAMEVVVVRFSAKPLLSNFDFTPINEQHGKFVDVGGAAGPVSIAIAEKYPNMSFVVQDLPKAIRNGREKLPAKFKDRITFMEHNFFDEQPIVADVYFFRAVFRNWPDKDCVRMLKALIPSLRKGARVLVHDACVPDPGTVSKPFERVKRNVDLSMWILFNGRDRSLEEIYDLFSQADKRFKITQGHFTERDMPPDQGKGMVVVEAVWEGDD